MLSVLLATARTVLAAGIAGVLPLALAACGGSHAPSPAATPPSASTPAQGRHPSMSMPSMSGMPAGNGLAAQQDGYTLASHTTTLPSGTTATYRFTITAPGGRPLTDFAVNQTKQLHFYAIRSDLTGFQHVHPTMAAGGTWTARLSALEPGMWRLFTQFTPADGPGKGQDLVLSRTVTVPGPASTTALPAPSSSTTVDGYALTVRGHLKAGTTSPLTVTVRKSSMPVTDLQPYLDTYAHLTAFRQGDLAFAHLHPQNKVTGGHGGPTLDFMADLPASGNWRLFLQFQTAGTLHTASITLHVS
ncbi:hypothetical protein [Streptomyces camelliae]|uniref:Secreted protein n=1 Tax=Streptomyces camelliae TaxID=3004093 RepID=A0ABY7P5Y9_9ACTN|nr:hypothetical protein [Streptomyces sp. HUAS 2-6]WBO65685.1 hypothetical protein O1G22_24145 [Streptomyces sp. HUAS 2-6]